MEWRHHNPPPPPRPPLQPSPPPPHHPFFSQSHFHNNNNNNQLQNQYHSHFHNPPPPTFPSHTNQIPCFEFLPDHPHHPTFQSHHNHHHHHHNHHNPNPNVPPSFELLLHDQHHHPPTSQLHHHQNHPSFQSHHPNHPSFELSLHDQHHPPSFRSHNQYPPPSFDLNPSFRSPATFSLHKPHSPFDHGYNKRPTPDELGGIIINERRLKLIHDHGSNDSILTKRETRGSFHEDLHLKRPRFEQYDVRNKCPMSNLNTHYKTDELSNQRGRNDLYPPNHDIRSDLPIPLQDRTVSENKSVSMDPKGPLFSDRLAPSLQEKPSSLFPIAVAASSYSSFSETQNSVQPCFQEKSPSHASNGITAQEFQPIGHRLSTDYPGEGQRFPLIPSSKPKALDASRIFKQPHRATRPDHIVVILRGLPGSGKSYLAKMMRDLEVDNGGIAPRIHSMDDYFMTEVEKVEESDNLRGKKPVVKMVMEYCYEAEMEEAYRSSMLKTFKKTLDEGAFPFVIVDDRNLRVADFAQFWAIAKRSGYEVYLLEATYKDPAGCAARNVHDFTLENIQKMADQWEEAPSMYLKLDAKSLLQGDDLKENTIQEVDMDTDDGESEDAQNGLAERYSNILAPAVENFLSSGRSKVVDSLNAESDHLREEVKELGRSKWSNDLEDDDGEKTEFSKGDNANALSAIVKSYKKEGKSVHWGDKAANTGFSIGAAKRVNTTLEIGPGSGYNSKSNPLPEELGSPGINGKSSMFQERIRAERESTRAVFDRRRNRIGGLDLEDE